MWPTFLRFAVCITASASLSSCFFFQPAEEVVVPLPERGAVIRIQVWGDTKSEGRFEVVLATQHGSARRELWENWGPAERASLYLSPDGRAVVLGGGGYAETFALSFEAGPRWIPYEQRARETGDDWRYLGAVDRYVDHLSFYPPSAQPECVPLYGAGFSLYRKSHQDKGSCANLNAS